MAIKDPDASQPIRGALTVTWDGIATGDTINWYKVPDAWGALAEVQMYTDSGGAWGGATVGMEVTSAPDGDGAKPLKTTLDGSIAATEDSIFKVEVLSVMVRPTISGGTSDDINVILTMRGGVVKN